MKAISLQVRGGVVVWIFGMSVQCTTKHLSKHDCMKKKKKGVKRVCKQEKTECYGKRKFVNVRVKGTYECKSKRDFVNVSVKGTL